MPPSSMRPRPLPCFVAIGFVGKRVLLEGACAAARTTLAAELDHIAVELPAPQFVLTGISPLAEGADTLFGEELARRGWLHRIFLPEPADRFFNKQDFDDAENSRRLLDSRNVIEVRVASRQHHRNERFAETGIEVANASETLLAMCTADEWRQAVLAAETGQSPSDFRRGGTAETVTYALRAGKPVRAVIVDDPPESGLLRVERIGAISGAACQRLSASSFFDAAQSPAPLAALDYRAELAAIAGAADRQSARGKRAVTAGGAIVLGTHVLATATAAAALIFEPWHASFLPPLGKAVLLLLGFGTAVWLHYRRQHTQEAWVEGRLVAEICRSARTLVGTGANDEPYPGGLRHLRDFELGDEFRAFTSALHILHLREVRHATRARTSDPAEEKHALERFRDRYAVERVEDQLRYFEGKHQSAHVYGHNLEKGFFVFSGLALFGAALGVALFNPHAEHLPMWQLVLIKFVPLALPVAAAAMIAWIGLRDLDRRDHRFAEMIALLKAELPRFRRTVSPSILRRRVLEIERALLQEVIEWHQRNRHQRAG